MTKEQIQIIDYLKESGLKELKTDLVQEIESRIYSYEKHDNRDLWSLQDSISWDETVFQYLDIQVKEKLGLNINEVFEDLEPIDLLLNDYLDLSFDNYMNEHISKYQEENKNKFVEDLFYNLKDEDADINSLWVKHEKRWNKTYYFIEVELDNEEYILSEKHHIKYDVYFDEREIENELNERVESYKKSLTLEGQKHNIQKDILYQVWNQDKGDVIQDVLDYNEEDFEDKKTQIYYKEIMKLENKKLSEIITDEDMSYVIHHYEIEGGDISLISPDINKLSKINEDIKELNERKFKIKNKLLGSWKQVDVLNTNTIKQHQEDYKSLDLATNIEDIIAIENKFKVNLGIKELNLKDIKNNEDVFIFDYVVNKKYPNNKNLIFEENQKEVLRRNNVYNSELNTTQLKRIYQNCDLIYKDNQLWVDLNSYDKNDVKNDMNFDVLKNLETKLNKDFSKEESKNLLLLSSTKNEDKAVVNVNELKNNINEFLEVKKQNLISDALIDHKITRSEKKEIENFEKQKNEIIGGI